MYTHYPLCDIDSLTKTINYEEFVLLLSTFLKIKYYIDKGKQYFIISNNDGEYIIVNKSIYNKITRFTWSNKFYENVVKKNQTKLVQLQPTDHLYNNILRFLYKRPNILILKFLKLAKEIYFIKTAIRPHEDKIIKSKEMCGKHQRYIAIKNEHSSVMVIRGDSEFTITNVGTESKDVTLTCYEVTQDKKLIGEVC